MNTTERCWERRQARREKGLCCQCGLVPVVSGQARCDGCLAKRRQNRQFKVAEYKRAGMCSRCCRYLAKQGSAWCLICLRKEAARQKRVAFERAVEFDLITNGIETH